VTRVFAALLSLSLVGVPTGARAKNKRRKPAGPYGPSSRVVRSAEAHGQASLRVRSIDLGRRVVVVEVGGFPRPPAGNLFTFVDERGRKFVAVSAACESPFPSGVRICDLVTPEGYERHPWVGLELHLHGLSSSTVAAPREEVERAFEAARALLETAGSQPSEDDKAAPAEPTPPPDLKSSGEEE